MKNFPQGTELQERIANLRKFVISVYCNQLYVLDYRDGSRISGKGDHMNEEVGVRFADFISFFLNIP